MEGFVKGDIVVTSFPFSDLTAAKRRPALILASFENEFILAQVTSEPKFDQYFIPLRNAELEKGNLAVDSWVRINKLFTSSNTLILYKIGAIKEWKRKRITQEICAMFQQ